jgi:hypothetical protein
MFESDIEKTIFITAIVLWFAHGWYLNKKLKDVHEKLDKVFQCFDGLKDYLYEIDPQFDDERENLQNLNDDENLFSGIQHMELLNKKEKAGKRTLNTSFLE